MVVKAAMATAPGIIAGDDLFEHFVHGLAPGRVPFK